MRIFVPSSLRAFWRDRAPTVVAEFSGVSPAQGVNTIIDQYTVPAGRVAIIERVSIIATLQVAMLFSETLSLDISILNTIPAFIYRDVLNLQNGEGPGTLKHSSPGPYQLPAGHIIQMRVNSGMITGTVNVDGALYGVEYDL